MLAGMVLRAALTASATMFGSLGVFFVYLSFLTPVAGVHAVMFLGLAVAILRAAPER